MVQSALASVTLHFSYCISDFCVLDLPTISLSSNQTTKIVGQSMIFECAATDANGDVEITWQKANQSTYDSTRVSRFK